MYKFTEDIRIKLEPFLKENIDFKEKAYENNCLTILAVNQSIKALCNNGVFTVEELSKTVIAKCDVILPVCVINEILGVIK